MASVKGLDVLMQIKANTDQLIGELNKTKKQVQGMEGTFGKMRNMFGTMKGFVMAAVGSMVYQVGKDFVKLSGEFDTVNKAFENLASSAENGSDGLLKAMRTATAGTVSNLDIMKSSNLAIQLMGEEVIQHLPKMAEVARSAARTQGKEVAQMLEDIVVASGRRSVMILDNLGISSATASRYMDEYASTLGTTRDKLNDTQKSAAFFYAVMKAGEEVQKKTGGTTMTLGERLQMLDANLKNLTTTIASELTPVWENFIDDMDMGADNAENFGSVAGKAIGSVLLILKATVKMTYLVAEGIALMLNAVMTQSPQAIAALANYFDGAGERIQGINKDVNLAFSIWDKKEKNTTAVVKREQEKKRAQYKKTGKALKSISLSEYYSYLGRQIEAATAKEEERLQQLVKKHRLARNQITDLTVASENRKIEEVAKIRADYLDWIGQSEDAQMQKDAVRARQLMRIFKDDLEARQMIYEEYQARKMVNEAKSTAFGKSALKGTVEYSKQAFSAIDSANRQLVYNMMWGKGGWNEFKKQMKNIFRQLLADIAYAIIRAAILQAILSASGFGGGGIATRAIASVFERGYIPPKYNKGFIPAYPSGYVPADHHLAYVSDSEAVINQASTRANYDQLKWMNENPGQSMNQGSEHVANISVQIDGREIGRATDSYRNNVQRNSSLSNYNKKGAYKS